MFVPNLARNTNFRGPKIEKKKKFLLPYYYIWSKSEYNEL